MSQFFVGSTAGNLPSVVLETLTGNDGLPVSPTAHNIDIKTDNATPQFEKTATSTLTLDFGLRNLILGSDAASISSADLNTGVGFAVFTSLTSGQNNVGFGGGTLANLTESSNNMAIGTSALSSITIGIGANTAIGFQSLSGLLTGINNIALGSQSGTSYLGSESSNILISNTGTLGESNTTRIGTQGSASGQQNTCYIAGIAGVTTAAPAVVTLNTSTGQLSTVLTGADGNVLTSSGGAWVSSTPLPTKYTSTAISYLATSLDYIIGCTASTITITLPTAGLRVGQTFIIKDESGTASAGSPITITVLGGVILIDGATTNLINNSYGSISLYWNGSKYSIY